MKLSVLDRLAMRVAPKRAAVRIASRMRATQVLTFMDSFATQGTTQRSETRWRGASQTLRSMAGWVTTLGSGRSDTSRPERERLQARSYDAHRNHLIARAAIGRMKANVVGTGLTMHPAVDGEALGISEEEADDLNLQIGSEWELYYDNPREVDYEGMLDGYGLQQLGLITSLLGGDCFALTPFEEREGCIYGLKIQLIDPARVSNNMDQPNSALLQDGVELAISGQPIAVHIRDRHPGDAWLGRGVTRWMREMVFAPSGARRVFQIWADKDRIGTTRGVPWLAPILEPLQTLEQYTRAELIAAVISAMFTVFIKKENTPPLDDRGNPLPLVEGMTSPTKGIAPDLQLGNGAILDLNPGEDAQFANPARPNSNFDEFFRAIVRQIGAALDLPADELMLFYNSSYSAARAAMLQAWRMYSMRRYGLVQQFCSPHYGLWFDEMVARGRLQVTDYADPKRRAAYQRALWIGPARGAMDETQEASAAAKRIETGLSNETIETALSAGENWRTVYAQRLREIKRRRVDGTLLGPQPGQAAPPMQTDPQPPKPAEDPLPSDDNEVDDGGDPPEDQPARRRKPVEEDA